MLTFCDPAIQREDGSWRVNTNHIHVSVPETQPSTLQREKLEGTKWGWSVGVAEGMRGWRAGEQANKKHLLVFVFPTWLVTCCLLSSTDEKLFSLNLQVNCLLQKIFSDFRSTPPVPLRYSQSIICPHSVKVLIRFY